MIYKYLTKYLRFETMNAINKVYTLNIFGSSYLKKWHSMALQWMGFSTLKEKEEIEEEEIEEEEIEEEETKIDWGNLVLDEDYDFNWLRIKETKIDWGNLVLDKDNDLYSNWLRMLEERNGI
jgi:hypothetical protein